MEKVNYTSNREFMMSQFPELFQESTSKINSKNNENSFIPVEEKKPMIDFSQLEIVSESEFCSHEHCLLHDHQAIGNGKLTLVYRCEECGEQFLSCKSLINGMATTIVKSFSNKPISLRKIIKKVN